MMKAATRMSLSMSAEALPPARPSALNDGALGRSHAFVAISMGCRDPLQHKVHFEPKNAFEDVAL
jgi:hypothetical protein